MADISDVLDAIGGVIAGALHPDGTRYRSAVGEPVTVVSGWPNKTKLDATLDAKRVYVSVFPIPNMGRSAAHGIVRWEERRPSAPTLSVSVSGETVTLAGSGSIAGPQNVAVVVDGKAYVATAGPQDSAVTVAAALAILIGPEHPGSGNAGSVLTVPDAKSLEARVGVTGQILGEVEREQTVIATTIWAPSPKLRAGVGRIARGALAASPRLSLADGSAANLSYRLTFDDDGMERSDLYKRDIHYWVDFATFVEAPATEVIVPTITGLPSAR